ncbi:HlyD family type I secretion periplasmic adaptor subunit [Albidovulum sp.]|uniref:HlyD family type I secretion periplasmic adaptor subunit n=1 Tax=Albidovulum sp. TaxID=1872424 RepID=UPI001D23BD1A|nr:HlyD family type I secretion periplasmic adaptor subunit [Paracoccaceae bacterium]HPE26519.1 HlyD family type I secretion periplasmic adaptor subunit [Albidovulum sp.]MCB2120847.1 HlyD family type I secretion periplasmic adaptor subunit [Paracoccaceae bacterium]MCB2123275.1 HlyD family type I secretion periplasmic adaptor subunit [Paracoccaceae bacterium]MCB2132792.1 HlyD family type I secretion periplasmic adaptor subunit [Paracoccaceae bacterium]
MADVAQIPNAHQWYDSVPRSIRWHAIFGLTLMVVAFGSFGVWAFRAPLAAAVIAQGSFVATGQNKIVQHLEGGIISQILVREGDSVAAGAPILKLDETLAEATKRELTIRQARLEATEARLMAQHLDQDRLVYDDALESQRGDPEVATILESQKLAFSVARSGLHNDIALIERNMDALVARQRGYVLQRQSLEAQLQIVLDDLKIKDSLLEGGMVARDKVTMLRRAELEATGQLARIEAEILEIDEMRQKFQTQIDKTRDEYSKAALAELQAIQAEAESVREQVRKAANVLNRTEVLAPVSGTVVRLYYHTSGGVIETGRAIAEILPDDAPLIIETLVPRGDIDSVKIGQKATARLIALNQRTTPILNGTVEYVSADAVASDTGQQARREAYVVRVSLTPAELARVQNFAPKPGMPVEIMIKTEERTFAQYIAKPVLDSMSRAFREQ